MRRAVAINEVCLRIGSYFHLGVVVFSENDFPKIIRLNKCLGGTGQNLWGTVPGPPTGAKTFRQNIGGDDFFRLKGGEDGVGAR